VINSILLSSTQCQKSIMCVYHAQLAPIQPLQFIICNTSNRIKAF